ncbi:MAG TPA: hypothetical protein VG295_09325 [Solirubrobacteraceae bacterium]|nr:hypothetical protein [Solirubrobacteraceae bacterium]
MDVLVGVEVRGVATGQLTEAAQLALEFDRDGLLVVGVDDLVYRAPFVPDAHPLGQVDVHPEREVRIRRRGGDGLRCRRPIDHQARRRDDALGMGA